MSELDGEKMVSIEDGSSLLDRLCDDVLPIVASFLTAEGVLMSLCRVCRRFLFASRHPSLLGHLHRSYLTSLFTRFDKEKILPPRLTADELNAIAMACRETLPDIDVAFKSKTLFAHIRDRLRMPLLELAVKDIERLPLETEPMDTFKALVCGPFEPDIRDEIASAMRSLASYDEHRGVVRFGLYKVGWPWCGRPVGSIKAVPRLLHQLAMFLFLGCDECADVKGPTLNRDPVCGLSLKYRGEPFQKKMSLTEVLKFLFRCRRISSAVSSRIPGRVSRSWRKKKLQLHAGRDRLFPELLVPRYGGDYDILDAASSPPYGTAPGIKKSMSELTRLFFRDFQLDPREWNGWDWEGHVQGEADATDWYEGFAPGREWWGCHLNTWFLPWWGCILVGVAIETD